jgi:hypothetical protein
MTPQVGTRKAVMDWARMLAYDTGTVDQELLARNEYQTYTTSLHHLLRPYIIQNICDISVCCLWLAPIFMSRLFPV